MSDGAHKFRNLWWTGRDLNPRLPPCEGGDHTRLIYRPNNLFVKEDCTFKILVNASSRLAPIYSILFQHSATNGTSFSQQTSSLQVCNSYLVDFALPVFFADQLPITDCCLDVHVYPTRLLHQSNMPINNQVADAPLTSPAFE